MVDTPDFEHVVFGSTPLCALLAGLLASAHGRRVCLVGDPHTAFRLHHGFDLAIDVMARPETLTLLQGLTEETLKLINGLGKGLVERIDPLFISETAQSSAGLDHFRHLALAFGYGVEPIVDPQLSAHAICRVRDVAMLPPGRIEPALEAWLDGLGVRRLARSTTEIWLRRDGTVRLTHNDSELTGANAVLADDAAVTTHVPEDQRDKMLVSESRLLLLAEPDRAVPGPLLCWLDRGVSVNQAGRAGIAVVAGGDPATAAQRIGASAARHGALKRAGEALVPALRTADGAPYLGTARNSRATVLAGFGPTAAFFAPAIARYIAGAARSDEAAWFTARGASRGRPRSSVTDISMVTA
ncbi:hypothetical protein [Devosia sp.]|uniref:hypothetical protein n=1 Tax=Devosia sp. TaxID=1871048 RepID=UPI003A95DDE6